MDLQFGNLDSKYQCRSKSILANKLRCNIGWKGKSLKIFNLWRKISVVYLAPKCLICLTLLDSTIGYISNTFLIWQAKNRISKQIFSLTNRPRKLSSGRRRCDSTMDSITGGESVWSTSYVKKSSVLKVMLPRTIFHDDAINLMRVIICHLEGENCF